MYIYIYIYVCVCVCVCVCVSKCLFDKIFHTIHIKDIWKHLQKKKQHNHCQ